MAKLLTATSKIKKINAMFMSLAEMHFSQKA